MTELSPRRRSKVSLLDSGEASKRLKMITGFYGVLAGVYAAGLTVMVAAVFIASGPNVATFIPRAAQVVIAAASFVSILQTYRLLRHRRRSGAIAAAIPVVFGIANQLQRDGSNSWLSTLGSVVGLMMLATVWDELE